MYGGYPALKYRRARGDMIEVYKIRFMDNSPTNQLTDTPTRRQSISPTNQLADNKLADRPTRRQLNWPKNQLAEIEIVTKIDVRFFGHMDVSFW